MPPKKLPNTPGKPYPPSSAGSKPLPKLPKSPVLKPPAPVGGGGTKQLPKSPGLKPPALGGGGTKPPIKGPKP
jgi:hypothetical protein